MKRLSSLKVAKYLNKDQNPVFLTTVWGVKVYEQG